MGLLTIGKAVIKLGDLSLPQELTEPLETSRTFRDRDRQDCLTTLTELRSLRHVAQTVKVDIGTTIERNQGLSFNLPLLHIALQSSHSECPGRLGNRAGIIKNIFDCGTDLVRANQYHLIHQLLADSIGLLTDLAYRHSIGKDPHLLESHSPFRRQSGVQGRGVVRFDPDHPDIRIEILDVGGHSSNEPSPTYWNKDRVDLPRVLPQNLHRDGSLSSNHIRIIIGVNQRQLLLLCQLQGMAVSLIIGVSGQHRPGTILTHGLNLDIRGGTGHHNHRLDPHLSCR